MEQRLNFITLAVADTERSKAFYGDGLGWVVDVDVPGEVLFLQVAPGVVLSLWSRAGFAEEVGEPGGGIPPITLAHNESSVEEVDAALARARAAGAATVQPGQHRDWGGYSGYFTDPDGFRWEVAWNPTPYGERILAESRAWLSEAARRDRGR